jgi:hypothetical protein
MVALPSIIVFIISYFYVYLFYSIIATSHIEGWNSNSGIYVGKNSISHTGIGIPTHTCVCLEVNTHTQVLDYFINEKHVEDRVVNVPKDVYFGV